MKPTYQGQDRLNGQEIQRILEDLHLLPSVTSPSRSHDRRLAGVDAAFTLALRHFQQERGLVAHGTVDAETHQELVGARYHLGDRDLSYVTAMLRGDDVRQLQQQLAELGFHHGNQDGIFGPITETSLRSFQSDYGLTIDGTCGLQTARALRNLLPKVTGGSASALVSQAYRHSTGPDLAGRYIVLDPARAVDERAKDFLVQLTERVRYQLELLGANAILAQNKHEELSANERSTRANDVGAEIFLSMDVAHHGGPYAEGAAAFYFGSPYGASQVGRELAGLLQREIAARTQFTDLGEHPRVLETLRATRMPSVHLELGYLSNADDRARMSDGHVRDSITDALIAGLQRFYLVRSEDHPTGTWRVPRATVE